MSSVAYGVRRDKPPVGNTGAQNTRVELDWLDVTFPVCMTVDDVKTALGLDDVDWVGLERGRHGYTCQIAWGGVRILYAGREDMGVHVTMSGDAVDAWLAHTRLNEDGLIDVLGSWLHMGAHFTRIDGALDDFSGAWSIEQVKAAVKRGEVVSRFKVGQCVESVGLVHGDGQGSTVYLGSPQSDVRVRFYDKAAEQGSNEPWNRVEVQMRDERAQAFVTELVGRRSFAQVLCGVLRNYVKICLKREDKNRSRWPLAPWWDALLAGAERLRLKVPEVKRTIEQVRKWIERQVAPMLAVVLRADMGDMTWLLETLWFAQTRWKSRHKELLAGA